MFLKVKGLTLTSGDRIIVDQVSFDMRAGEIVALTGKSGSGKTSVGLAILGLLPPGMQLKTGTVDWIQEEHILQYPRDLQLWKLLRGRQIAYIQQDVFGIFDPVLPMGKQMLMVVSELSKNPSSDFEASLREKLVESGIEEVDRIWNSYPHQLSGGQLQRCQICVAIILQPSLIIADEPTSAIDKVNQVEILDLFAFVRKQYNIAILCITHENAVVQYLADRSISMDASPGNPLSLNSNQGAEKLTHAEATILTVDQLGFTHRFGGIFETKGASICNISFSLRAGECLGIIGESGSGKSTLAQLLVGLLSPSKGTVVIANRKINYNKPSDISLLRSKIQLVLQDGRGSLHPNRTIRWILDEIIEHQKRLGERSGLNMFQALERVGLSPFILDKYASALSGGECLRISIARALLIKPSILICDESTTSLDGPTRDSIIMMLIGLMKEQGLGLILIAHDEDIISKFTDEVIVMAGGEVVEKGPTLMIMKSPNHEASKKIMSAHATLSGKRVL